MKRTLTITALLLLQGIAAARADQTTASVQQSLKDEGFFYGTIDGNKTAETTAAIRRYQIRNGLQVTGEADAETLKALSATPTPPAPVAAAPTPAAARLPAASDLRDPNPVSRTGQRPAQAYNPQRPATHGFSAAPRIDEGGPFADTPYEAAPTDLQRQVMVGAQTLLSRRGYYREGADGVFGPATAGAIRTFQTRNGIPPSGRLDMDTLAALGLLPGQRVPGIAVPERRVVPRPILRSAPPQIYRGEWVPEETSRR